MSHDLEFAVVNGDGSTTRQQQQQQEVPIQGEMDHLPDNAAQSRSTDERGGSLQYIQEKLQQSAHPTVIIFHLLFKVAALVLYILGGFFVGKGINSGANFIAVTVACILLLAADFWVVKNVTGRLLVGLRWWNKVEDDTTTWIFESAEDKAVNAFDRRVFWTVLYATPVLWTGFFILGLLKFNFSWLLIVIMALLLSIANVYGYYRCSGEQKARFQSMMQQSAQQGAMAMMRSSMVGLVTGRNSTTV